ncbi:MAG: hypothetical protein NC417_10815 [Candidatus Gastranaerophilales bacterium]|nr:hypothetical protein [Candidatus Gastranaerophilales bacterium]
MWMDKISKEEFNEESFLQKINNYMKSNKIILYGAGDRAKFLYDYLTDHSIHISAVVISRKYWKNGMKMRGTDIEVVCFEDYLLSYTKNVVIILGLPKYLLQENFSAFPNVCDVVDINMGVRKDYIIKRSFLFEHEKEMTELYEMLEDDKSRDMLTAHLNGRITGKSVPYEKMPWTDPSYFLKEFIRKEVSPWLESECIVDCGAYIGDTYEEFKESTALSNLKNYKYYCIEPDSENVGYLKKKYRFDDNIIIYDGGHGVKRQL